MNKANILVVEDDPSHAFLARVNLEARKHCVVRVASSVLEALAYLALAADNEIPEVEPVQIVLTDGNPEAGQHDGRGGATVAAYAHEALPGVVVIGWSATGNVCGADYNLEKGDIPGLGRLIMDLPDPRVQTIG